MCPAQGGGGAWIERSGVGELLPYRPEPDGPETGSLPPPGTTDVPPRAATSGSADVRRITAGAVHLPPRGAGMPLASSSAAMARSEVRPLALISATAQPAFARP